MNIIAHFSVQLRRIFTLALLSGCISVTAQVVNIPDPNFKAALVSNAEINTNGDEEIQQTEASAFTGVVRVNDLGIESLTGIEAFTAITGLNCAYNLLTSLDISANIQLTELRCNHNALQTLDVSANPDLISLECFSNQLASLSVSTNESLTSLKCFNNKLTSLDLGLISGLTDLRCNHNLLTHLDLGANNLKTLYVYNNQLGALDLTGSPQLTDLNCEVNRLSLLDLRENTLLKTLNISSNNLVEINVDAQEQLQILSCQSNRLAVVDLSNHRELTTIDFKNNNLIYLNIQNGRNLQLTTFNARGNSHLDCIQVDDPTYSTDNWLQVDAGSIFSNFCDTDYNDIVSIPDPKFKDGLAKNHSIDQNGDEEIQVSEAEIFDGTISVRFAQVADITGVESFPLLRGLIVNNNLIETMDLKANTELEHLDFSNNSVSTLDLSHNPKLTFINFGRNQLSTLDVTLQSDLRELHGDDNHLTSLDLQNNPSLTTLSVSNNALSSIDFSKNRILEGLTIQNNQLTTLDVHSNTALKWLFCIDNKLTSLDLSTNTMMEDLVCYRNQLTTLNLKSGFNWRLNRMEAKGNPDLACIQVDDVTAARIKWGTGIDPWTEFLLSCELEPIVFIPDYRLKEVLVSNVRINTNDDEEIQRTEAQSFTENIDVSSMEIEDMTGIEAFTKCPHLQVNNNNLTKLDVHLNTRLVQLQCQENKLTSLNIRNGNNHNLLLFDARNNNLSCIQVDEAAYAVANFKSKVDPDVTLRVDCSIVLGSSDQIAFGNVYPNPFSNSVTVSRGDGPTMPVILIYNILGRSYEMDQVTLNENQATIELSTLQSGFYILQVDQHKYRIVKE